MLKPARVSRVKLIATFHVACSAVVIVRRAIVVVSELIQITVKHLVVISCLSLVFLGKFLHKTWNLNVVN